jgi:hypothetical protein
MAGVDGSGGAGKRNVARAADKEDFQRHGGASGWGGLAGAPDLQSHAVRLPSMLRDAAGDWHSAFVVMN